MDPSIEEKIKNYWSSKTKFVSYDYEEKVEKIFEKIRERKFVDPTSATPVSAVVFASWLDTTALLSVVKDTYPYFDRIEDRLPARFRFLAYMVFSGELNLKKAWRSLTDEEYKLLGFTQRPEYELLREFINERIGTIRFNRLFDTIIQEVNRILKTKGLQLGARCAEDATDFRALKFDKEAEYSGYYKEYGYKVDYVIDLDNDGLPLHYTPLNINECEGKCCIPAQINLRALGMKPIEWKVDDRYASYENIADSYQNGTALICKIQVDWAHNPIGDLPSVKQTYQRYHKEPDFIPGASTSFMLNYLYEKGRTKVVGAYYRNQMMAEAAKNPEEWEKKCAERSAKMEGKNGQMKTQTGLDRRPQRRGWRAFVRTVALSMLKPVFAALIRVQHGVYTHLASIAYIT